MADKYMERYNAYLKSKGKLTSNKIEEIDKSIKNYKTRLEAGGVNVEKATDDRNWFEKLTNLPEGQNTVFDFFELLNRPQQALFTGIQNTQEGGDFLEGLKEGISGNEQTQFKDILVNAGMSDTEGKIDASDVLGWAGDIALDPMDILGGTKLVFKGLKGAAKGATKLTDNVIEASLKGIDKSKGITYLAPKAKYAEELGKRAINKIDDVGDVLTKTDKSGLFEGYRKFKNQIESAFNNVKSALPREVARTAEYKKNMLMNDLSAKGSKIKTLTKDYSEKVGKDINIVDNEINQIVENIERTEKGSKIIKKKDTLKNVLDSARSGQIKYTKSVVNNLNKLVEDIPEDILEELDLTINKGKNGMLLLGEGWNKIEYAGTKNGKQIFNNVVDKYLDEDKLNQVITKGSLYDKDKLNDLMKLEEEYYSTEEGKELIDSYRKYYDEANTKTSELFGTMSNLSEKYSSNVGYAKHALSKDYEKNVETLRKLGVSEEELASRFSVARSTTANKFNLNSGNMKTLAERKYKMSAGEANKFVKEDLLSIEGLTDDAKKFINDNFTLFDDMASSSMDAYLMNIPELAKDSEMIDKILVNQGFDNWEKAGKIKENLDKALMSGNREEIAKLTSEFDEVMKNSPIRVLNSGEKAPSGYKYLDKSSKEALLNKIDKMSKLLGDSTTKNIKNSLDAYEDLAIDPQVMTLLGVTDNTKDAKGLFRLYDKMINIFKSNKTLSPTFQLNNLIGNSSNMYLSGMDATTIAKRSQEAATLLRSKDEIFKKVAENGLESLTKDEAIIYDKLSSFMQDVGMTDSKKILELYDIPEELSSKLEKKYGVDLLNQLRKINMNMNVNTDQVFRLATYLEGLENPKYLKGLGVGTAGDAVRKVLFDPGDLTDFEKNVMKRIFPFYTFAKKNLAFQLSNIGNNGVRYNRLMKAYNSALTNMVGDDKDNIADYLKNNLYVPIPGIGKDGNYVMLRAQLPLGNLTDFVNNPLQNIVNLSSPLIKTPFEQATNTNTFTGLDLESFPGQKSTNIPFLTKRQENLLSSFTGLDVPIKQGARVYQGIQDSINAGDNLGSGLLKGITNTITLGGNVQKDELNKKYEELQSLQDMMSLYEQKGYEFSTINELKEANKNYKLSSIQTLLNKYNTK